VHGATNGKYARSMLLCHLGALGALDAVGTSVLVKSSVVIDILAKVILADAQTIRVLQTVGPLEDLNQEKTWLVLSSNVARIVPPQTLPSQTTLFARPSLPHRSL
jgi:hypothetical protein